MRLRKSDANPIVVKQHDWEGTGPLMGGSVLYDPNDALYKMWYSVWNRQKYFSHQPFSYNVCYAESKDGIHWNKPPLGVFEHQADPRNNFIRLGTDKTQNIDVCLNPRPDRYPGRFLAIHNQKGGVFVSHSDDGKSFTFLQDEPAISCHSDTHNNFVSDEVQDRLVGLRPLPGRIGYVSCPILVEGRRLLVNATIGGSLAVELRTDANRTIDGWSFEDCKALTHSGFAREVTWHGARLADCPQPEVRILFRLDKAALFTIDLRP